MIWLRRALLLLPAVLFVVAWPTWGERLTSADAIAAVTDAVTGWILIVAGIVALERRPGGRSGPLLILAGYLWYVGDLYFVLPDASIVPLLSFAFRGYYDLIFAFLLLSFPSGHLQTNAQRLVIGVMVALYVGRSLAFLALASPGRGYPDNGVANPFLLTPNGPIAQVDTTLLALQAVAIAVVAVLAIGSMARRVAAHPARAGAGACRRSGVGRDRGPVQARAVCGRFLRHTISPWEDADWWAIPDYLVRGAAAPVGFLIGALLLRTARTAVVDLVSGIADQPAREELEKSLIQSARPEPRGALRR